MRSTVRQLTLAAVLACAFVPAAPAWAQNNAPAAVTVSYAKADVLALADKAAEFQLAAMSAHWVPPRAAPDTADLRGWVQGAFYVGLLELANRNPRQLYQNALLLRGEANKWQLGQRLYHADDHVIGQAYFWASRNGAGQDALVPMQRSFDRILARPSTVPLGYDAAPGVDCTTRWCWCDAIFMGPPVWAEMSKVTGDPRYADFAKAELRATTEYLYDRSEHLYYRDSRFFERRGPKGEKVFWSRGNGWVFAGLVRMLAQLPQNDPGRAEIVATFRQMAVKLKAIQKPDGYWSPSLLGDPATSLPETSGTGFFTYGFAWGIKAGLLDRAQYEPVVRKGWGALVRSLHPSGKLGYVQPIGDRPDNVTFEDTQYYGLGAFLLAATGVADLELRN
jgi:rhamnogalacturonyl hydrolase YesR